MSILAQSVHGFTLIFSLSNLAWRVYNSLITTFTEAFGMILNYITIRGKNTELKEDYVIGQRNNMNPVRS